MPESVALRLAADIDARRLAFDASQRAAALRLDELVSELRAPPVTGMKRVVARLPWRSDARKGAPRGVYLWGGVGRGKTLLMDYFFAALEFADGAPGAMRAHFYHFMREVHAELRSITERETPLDVVAQRLAARARVICLDEFFVADIGDAMILAGLLAGLVQRGVTLVTTSNRAPQELYKDGLQRQRFLPAIELLQGHLDVIHLDGGVDYRLRQLEQAPTYLDSTRPGTATVLQERFAAMTGGTIAGPQTLTIEGRALRARAAAPGMAFFDFEELCEGPRSQNDYIELARLYHTLFIADIPRFDQFNENAARRFIMLIDELYDRGVKLVVSAAAPPAALYGGDRLRFEFERAASRLIEMQTQHYLAGQHRP